MLRIFSKNITKYSDDELIRKYKSNHELQYLGTLYERYMDLVYGVCLKYLNDRGKSEDAMMSIFETLVDKIKEHDIQNFKSWLHVLTKNHCLGLLRKEKQKSTLTIIYDEDIMQKEELVHHEDEVDDGTMMKIEIESLKNCIDKLKGTQKQCIELFYFEELSYKEIADTTGIEVKKVRSYIQNGRRNLKICIENKKKRQKVEVIRNNEK